jgi:hypothetical protein
VTLLQNRFNGDCPQLVKPDPDHQTVRHGASSARLSLLRVLQVCAGFRQVLQASGAARVPATPLLCANYRQRCTVDGALDGGRGEGGRGWYKPRGYPTDWTGRKLRRWARRKLSWASLIHRLPFLDLPQGLKRLRENSRVVARFHRPYGAHVSTLRYFPGFRSSCAKAHDELHPPTPESKNRSPGTPVLG